MGFLKKVLKEEAPAAPPLGVARYVDLTTYTPPPTARKAGMEVRVAEIDRFEDVRDLSSYVYDGDMLIIDFTPIANDELTMRRVISELKQLTQDVGGDLAGVSQNLLLVTPRGVKINRRKLRKGAL
jgi:hypothetical protein